jgi:hypothetical protein
MCRTDFEAVNARGVTIRTFGDLDHARRWVREHAPEHDGLHVDEVTTQVSRRRVFRPQIRLVGAARAG